MFWWPSRSRFVYYVKCLVSFSDVKVSFTSPVISFLFIWPCIWAHEVGIIHPLKGEIWHLFIWPFMQKLKKLSVFKMFFLITGEVSEYFFWCRQSCSVEILHCDCDISPGVTMKNAIDDCAVVIHEWSSSWPNVKLQFVA